MHWEASGRVRELQIFWMFESLFDVVAFIFNGASQILYVAAVLGRKSCTERTAETMPKKIHKQSIFCLFRFLEALGFAKRRRTLEFSRAHSSRRPELATASRKRAQPEYLWNFHENFHENPIATQKMSHAESGTRCRYIIFGQADGQMGRWKFLLGEWVGTLLSR